jgi:hypothetical protein
MSQKLAKLSQTMTKEQQAKVYAGTIKFRTTAQGYFVASEGVKKATGRSPRRAIEALEASEG